MSVSRLVQLSEELPATGGKPTHTTPGDRREPAGFLPHFVNGSEDRLAMGAEMEAPAGRQVQ